MRPWIIVSAAIAGAVAVAVAIAWPELATIPRAAILPALLPRLPVLAMGFLGVYALCTVGLTTAGLIGAALRLRRRLGHAVHLAANPLGWVAAFETTGLTTLAPQPAPVQPRSAWEESPVLWQARPDRRAARAEAARLYYIGLARTHFCSALIAIAAIIALGLAQDHSQVVRLAGRVPTVPAGLILVGLVLLAVLGRLAVDVTFEPVIETISRLPIDPMEMRLLRRAVEVLDGARGPTLADGRGPAGSSAPGSSGPGSSGSGLPERLAGVLEDGHRNLVEAIAHLSATADALGDTTRSSLEAIEAALRQPLPPAPASGEGGAGVRLDELQGAVEALTAALDRTSAAADAAGMPLARAELAAAHNPAEPQLARELQKLLQEIQ
ncbi:MAG: hypothetical protein ACREET_08840 [Stellaceae bacterium]